ncbi:CLUMA_CG012637, isoform A, partial [Clunio marinus]
MNFLKTDQEEQKNEQIFSYYFNCSGEQSDKFSGESKFHSDIQGLLYDPIVTIPDNMELSGYTFDCDL